MSSLREMFRACIAANGCSPDIRHLQANFTHVPVFVYGREKRGYSQGLFFKDVSRVGNGRTVQTVFTMYKTRQHEPAVFYRPHAIQGAQIYGEVYVIPLAKLWLLDEIESNTYFTHRRWIDVIFKKYDEKDVLTSPSLMRTEALMYCANESLPFWQEKSRLGDLVQKETYKDTDTGTAYHVYTRMDDGQCVRSYDGIGKTEDGICM